MFKYLITLLRKEGRIIALKGGKNIGFSNSGKFPAFLAASNIFSNSCLPRKSLLGACGDRIAVSNFLN
jgi:hypothetical protein